MIEKIYNFEVLTSLSTVSKNSIPPQQAQILPKLGNVVRYDLLENKKEKNG